MIMMIKAIIMIMVIRWKMITIILAATDTFPRGVKLRKDAR